MEEVLWGPITCLPYRLECFSSFTTPICHTPCPTPPLLSLPSQVWDDLSMVNNDFTVILPSFTLKRINALEVSSALPLCPPCESHHAPLFHLPPSVAVAAAPDAGAEGAQVQRAGACKPLCRVLLQGRHPSSPMQASAPVSAPPPPPPPCPVLQFREMRRSLQSEQHGVAGTDAGGGSAAGIAEEDPLSLEGAKKLEVQPALPFVRSALCAVCAEVC